MEKMTEIIEIDTPILISGSTRMKAAGVKLTKKTFIRNIRKKSGPIINWDIPLSMEKAPPLELYDLLNDKIITLKHESKELKRFEPLPDDIKKNYRDKGCNSLEMKWIKRDIIDLDEICNDTIVQYAREHAIDVSHVKSIEGSLMANGWIYDKSPIVLYELSPKKLAEIRAKNPNSTAKYGVVTGNHRISGARAAGLLNILADIYEYSNIEAVKIWASRLNKGDAPKKPSVIEDILRNWNEALTSGVYTADEKSFDTFIDVYGFDGFDPRTIKSLKKQLLTPTKIKNPGGRGNILSIESDPRRVKPGDPRSIPFIVNKFDIPSPIDKSSFGYATKDGRSDGLWRDHLSKIPTNPDNKIHVTLYTDTKKAGKVGLPTARREVEKSFNNKMSEVAEMIYIVNKNLHPELYKDENKEYNLKKIKENLPWKFNGFLPQLVNDDGDFIETNIVDADGKEYKKAVYAKGNKLYAND
jgi:hypothetical protein